MSRPRLDVHESHTRTVEARFAEGEVPEHRTPGGRSPISPRYVRIRYQCDRRWGPYVEMTGPRIDEPARGYLKRRLGPDDLAGQPTWLLDLIDEYEPNPADYRWPDLSDGAA